MSVLKRAAEFSRMFRVAGDELASPQKCELGARKLVPSHPTEITTGNSQLIQYFATFCVSAPLRASRRADGTPALRLTYPTAGDLIKVWDLFVVPFHDPRVLHLLLVGF
jgi:hypothetical protein